MFSFKNDYSESAHPSILQKIIDTNMIQTEGYGEDQYTLEAVELITKKLKDLSVDVHLLSGGTQTNLIAISAFLRPHEAVISAKTGHIVDFETGAIESTGHKIYTVESEDGKLNSSMVEKVFTSYQTEFTQYPKIVYISNPTELGTIYKKEELEDLYNYCKKNDLYLYIDGARLGSALASRENNVEYSDLTRLCDAFYIGGTKNGALYGEAIVLKNEQLKKQFRWHIKQKGALMSKSKVLACQFIELFKDNLYEDLASHANKMADTLREGLQDLGYKMYIDSPSNQTFVIVSKSTLEKIEKNYTVKVWAKLNNNEYAIRLVTCWATPYDKVVEFVKYLKKIESNTKIA